MRRSEVQHVLALLRRELNLSQEELALLSGKSTNTIKSVELGRLKLSESLAEIIGAATGVDPDCLLKNDLTAPLLDWHEKPYTAEVFRQKQAGGDSFTDGDEQISRWALNEYFVELFAVYVSAERKGRGAAYLFRNRLSRVIEDFRADFDIDYTTRADEDLSKRMNKIIGGELISMAELEAAVPGGLKKIREELSAQPASRPKAKGGRAKKIQS